MTALLTMAVLGLVVVVLFQRSQLREVRALSRPCERCGETGSTRAFRGSVSLPDFYREDLHVCSRCRTAQIEWLEHLFMLKTEGQFGFGRAGLVREANAQWGEGAVKILALLLVAEEDMDLASRILTPKSFAKVRPWIERHLREGLTPERKPPSPRERERTEASQKQRDGLGLAVGEVVRTVDGPFSDRPVRVADVDTEAGQVRLNVTVFGKVHSFSLDRSSILPASPEGGES